MEFKAFACYVKTFLMKVCLSRTQWYRQYHHKNSQWKDLMETAYKINMSIVSLSYIRFAGM